MDKLEYDSPFTKTKRNEKFLVFKSEKFALFQSDIQAKLMYENPSDVLIDGTFYASPKGVYQIIITRITLEEHKRYFTTSYILSMDKKEKTYKEILNKLNLNIKHYQLTKNKKYVYKPQFIHCDMESGLINALKDTWPYAEIKICYFHWHQAMEKQRKKFINYLNDKIENQELFKSLLTLPLIPSDIVENVFNELRNNNQDINLEPLFEYYDDMFIKKFTPDMCNYYNKETNRTNNACESYNKKLNSYFNSKPTIIKLINILTIEEESIFKEYSNIINEGLMSKRRRFGPSDYISCLPYFIEKEKDLKGSNASIRKKRLEIWLEAARRLPLN